MKMLVLLLGIMFLAGCSTGGGTTEPGNPSQPAFNCQNPIGGIVKHGESVTLFKDAQVAYGFTCKSEIRVCENGVLTGTYAQAACEVMPEEEPVEHEKAHTISDEGLKQGSIKEVGSKHQIVEVSRMFSPPPPVRPTCTSQPVIGSTCIKGTPVCMLGNSDYVCEEKKAWKVYGWIYEKKGLVHTPAEGVKVDIYNFPFCMQGNCSTLGGPTYSDKWGYFEFQTGVISTTLRLQGLPKYYAHCRNGKPIDGGGQTISGHTVGIATGPFKQLLVKEDSCAQGFFEKLFQAEDEALFNPNAMPIK